MLSHSKNQEVKIMKQLNGQIKNKGGRPAKPIKRNNVLTLKCASYEQARISANAKKASMTVSEFLREMGLNGQVVTTQKVLPVAILELTGTLNHMAANLNQIAKKRNSVVEELNAAERANLEILSREVKSIAQLIKCYLQ
ncbi:MAG: hypothetical protein J0I32_05210 [Sphingobacteriales bacterium]|nr:hypothetical protein [Sphingobacteriales bacterium]